MLCKFESVTVVSEGGSVFIIPHYSLYLSVLCKPSYNRDVSLYTPESENLSGFWLLCVKWFVRYYLYGRLFLYLSA